MEDFWPAVLEARRWMKDARTGSIQIRFGNGRPKLMSRQEDVTLGEAVRLPPGMVAYCPGCQGPTELRDCDNKVYCPSCDRLTTIWEVKTNQWYRPATNGRRDPHGHQAAQASRA